MEYRNRERSPPWGAGLQGEGSRESVVDLNPTVAVFKMAGE